MTRSQTWIHPSSRSGWLAAAATAGIVANGLRLRGRVAHLSVIDEALTLDTDETAMAVVTAAGVSVDDAVLAAATRHARREGLDVLDLVPGDLPLEQLLALVRTVDGSTYRNKPLAIGFGALQALVVDPAVLGRAGVTRIADLDPVEMVLLTTRLKQFAPRQTDLAIAPSLRSIALPDDQRMSVLRAQVGVAAPAVAGLAMLPSLAMLAALGSDPIWSAALVVASAVQPALITVKMPVQPRDVTSANMAVRLVREPLRALRTLRGKWQSSVRVPTDPRSIEERRPIYDELLAAGTDRFFEEPRTACPMCAGSDLTVHLTTIDLLQHKPGTFRLDVCNGCGHIFQNPRLSIEGLDFYYRDFYDGLGETDSEGLFAASDASYRGRAKMVARVEQPKRWLDVGAGHGHFCLIAAEELPDTHFDGLDMSESIEEAAARGWVEQGYRGMFPDLADRLAGTYDVVSMHHYLEHTREPLAEIEAAHTALVSNGLLLIELPNPESAFGNRLGRYWIPWFQPQHQNFLSIGRLATEVEARGFTVIDTEIGPAHQPVDLGGAAWMFAQHIAPRPVRPWLARPTVAQRVGRVAVFSVLGPIAAMGLAIDLARASRLQRNDRMSNTYRLLARRSD